MTQNDDPDFCIGELTSADLDTLSVHACVAEDPSSRDDYEVLRTSIEKVGVMRPLLVCSNGGVLSVIDGEKRLEAARSVKLKEAPVVVLYDVKAEEAIDLRNLGNAFIRHHAISQRAAIVGRARVRVEEVIARNFSLYGTHRPPSRRILTEISHMSKSVIFHYSALDSDMIDEFKVMVDNGEITDRMARIIFNAPQDAQRALYQHLEEKGVKDKGGIEKVLRTFNDPDKVFVEIERSLRETFEVMQVSDLRLSSQNIEELQKIIKTAAEILGLAGTSR